MVKLNNVTQNVENNLCEDAGLPIPNTIQKCETNDCPHWIVNDWQACNSSRCFAWNTGIQNNYFKPIFTCIDHLKCPTNSNLLSNL